jgi:hypothetical protein
MYAFGIIYPQYWLQEGVEASFQKHLVILKQHYASSHVVCAMESGGEEINMLEMLIVLSLDIQTRFFQNDYEEPNSCCYVASS